MKKILGISAGFHDGAVALIDTNGEILFASHSERYSKVKNDPGISPDMLADISQHDIDVVAYYERPFWHNVQRIISGQRPLGPWTLTGTLMYQLNDWYDRILAQQCRSFPHHLSHAAAGFQTSPFHEAAVVVIDAIGELDTISIYRAWYDDQGRARYQRLWRQHYPHSIGLFYSAITKAVGLRPMDEEYITMGMSAYGQAWRHQNQLMTSLLKDQQEITFARNLHIGFDPGEFSSYDDTDVAAAAQSITEMLVNNVVSKARRLVDSDNLVYMGGVALNCVANSRLGAIYDNIWIMPNPGDAGSSLGAAALAYGKKLNWNTAFLGHAIPGDYPVEALLRELETRGIVGVASGAAEFGPRALGNRSLLADPSGPNIKDKVNDIKRRQKFRPFAPAILEEYCLDYFDMPRGWRDSRYMQVVADCRCPDLFPAVVHVDGTSRVQTVGPDGSGLRKLLEAWYLKTGCPMLLNTSLNIRGEPMVNDRDDADRFENLYGVQVHS